MKRFLQQCKQNTEACAWVLSAVIVLVYGNGRFDLITVLLHHPDVWRFVLPVLVGVVCAFLHSLQVTHHSLVHVHTF